MNATQLPAEMSPEEMLTEFANVYGYAMKKKRFRPNGATGYEDARQQWAVAMLEAHRDCRADAVAGEFARYAGFRSLGAVSSLLRGTVTREQFERSCGMGAESAELAEGSGRYASHDVEVLRWAMGRLSEEAREAVTSGDEPWAKTARRMGIGRHAVATRWHRSMTQLRVLLHWQELRELALEGAGAHLTKDAVATELLETISPRHRRALEGRVALGLTWSEMARQKGRARSISPERARSDYYDALNILERALGLYLSA